MSAEPTSIPTLLSVNQFLAKHSWATAAWLRAALFRRDTNGLNRAVVQAGRKILLDERKFFSWLEANNNKGAGNANA